MNEEELKKVRDFLVNNVFRNPHVILYDNIASDALDGCSNGERDVL